jgi:hypothetical protein
MQGVMEVRQPLDLFFLSGNARPPDQPLNVFVGRGGMQHQVQRACSHTVGGGREQRAAIVNLVLALFRTQYFDLRKRLLLLTHRLAQP